MLDALTADKSMRVWTEGIGAKSSPQMQINCRLRKVKDTCISFEAGTSETNVYLFACSS